MKKTPEIRKLMDFFILKQIFSILILFYCLIINIFINNLMGEVN
jgi:hypothetical protein